LQLAVTVIVPTCNRAHAIIACLDCIVASVPTSPFTSVDIIVVNNASTDNTEEVVQKWAALSPVPCRLLFEPSKGVSSARNCGMRMATGDLLVFIDDDCQMHANYIADLLRYAASDTGLVLRGGSVVLGDSTDLPLSIIGKPEIRQFSCMLNSARHTNLGDALLGCNMAMSKAVADTIGPFDPYLGAGTSIPGGEDIDYVYRAYLLNITIESVPDMQVFHFHGRRHLSEGTKLFQNYSIGGGALFAKYIFFAPALCRPYYWDAKNLAKEIISKSSNLFMPSINFSYKSKLLWYYVGIQRYLLMRIRRNLLN